MNGSPPIAVLDASALIALIYDEPAAGRVADVLRRGALISTVNWAEVLSDMAERGEAVDVSAPRARSRSEERRVGKECRL